MIVPYESLSVDALRGVIEEFVTRDGTDYGVTETILEARVQQVKHQLRTGEVVILYSEARGDVNIVPRHSL